MARGCRPWRRVHHCGQVHPGSGAATGSRQFSKVTVSANAQSCHRGPGQCGARDRHLDGRLAHRQRGSIARGGERIAVGKHIRIRVLQPDHVSSPKCCCYTAPEVAAYARTSRTRRRDVRPSCHAIRQTPSAVWTAPSGGMSTSVSCTPLLAFVQTTCTPSVFQSDTNVIQPHMDAAPDNQVRIDQRAGSVSTTAEQPVCAAQSFTFVGKRSDVLQVGWHGRAREAGKVGAADAGQCPTSETMPAAGAARDSRPAVKHGATGGEMFVGVCSDPRPPVGTEFDAAGNHGVSSCLQTVRAGR